MANGVQGAGNEIKMRLALTGQETVCRKLDLTAAKLTELNTKILDANEVGDDFGKGMNNTATSSGKLSKGLHYLALRFVGLQAAVNFAMQTFHKLSEWIGQSIEQFRDFDKRIAEVSTILGGEAVVNTMALQAGIENLSKAYGQSANDLAEGTYQILSAAFNAKEAIQLLNTATKASIAGLTDVATSVDVFTSILNSYGKTVAQATGVSDILFQTVVRGKLRFEDLASAMGYITPIAANAGVAFDEIAAALSTVTRMGLHVDMATRGLALGIQDIIDPTKAAAEAARQYEVDMSAVALRVKGLEGFINDLNKAMQDYGTSILPEMIRNMRSMRVFMALAGEEGVLGFAEDLDLLTKSTGKTEEALSKMMNAAKMESDMLAQSMEYLERRIGEAWHGFDIWWRKAQLWWGTLFSGGDADKAVKEYEERVYQIRQNYYEMLKAESELSGKPSLFNQIMGGDTGAISSVNFDKIKKYFTLSEEIDKQANAGYGLEYAFNGIQVAHDKYLASARKEKDVTEWLNIAKDAAKQFGIQLDTNKDGSIGAKEAFDALNNTFSEWSNNIYDTITGLVDQRTSLQGYVDYYTSSFDDATEAINRHTENIMELEYALKNLNKEVTDVYTSLGGQTFYGTLDRDIALATEEMGLSRSQQYTNMAIKYGAEFINEYNDELSEAILTVHSYKEAQEELNRTLERHNIEILKLEIKGMKRRRGLTRAEEIRIKKLRLASMEARVDAYEAQTETDQTFEEAQRTIDEFYDRWAHEIFELKDIRDDEIQDMEDDYAYKKGLVSEYTGYLEDEYEALEKTYDVYRGLLESAMEEELGMYFQQYGIDLPAEIQKTIDKLDELHKKQAGQTYIPSEEAIENSPTGINTRIPRWKWEEKVFGRGNYDTGTYNVPATGFYRLKQGETVAPRGSQRGGGNTIINNNKIYATIRDRYDVERLARDLSTLASTGSIRNVENDIF